MKINLESLATEARNQNTMNLDLMSPLEIVTVMNEEDSHIAQAVRPHLKTVALIAQWAGECVRNGGRIIYMGAALAIRRKAKRLQNDRLVSVISGAVPAGIFGVGEPLIYGVTLPMGRPFITAGLEAGFGGAFIMAMQVAATTWGPSGILGCFVMTAGPNRGIKSILFYLMGLIISIAAAYIITDLLVTDEQVLNA